MHSLYFISSIILFIELKLIIYSHETLSSYQFDVKQIIGW